MTVKPEETTTDIRSIRQTKNGEILLELRRESKDIQTFTDAVKATLGDTGVVRNLVTRVTLELLDLDSLTTKEDVEGALRIELQEKDGNMKVSVSKANSRGQVTAFFQIDEKVAKKLL